MDSFVEKRKDRYLMLHTVNTYDTVASCIIILEYSLYTNYKHPFY